MGYETRFKLTALTDRNYSQRDYLKVHPREFSPLRKNSRNRAYKDDMRKLSLAFPNTYFLLYGKEMAKYK